MNSLEIQLKTAARVEAAALFIASVISAISLCLLVYAAVDSMQHRNLNSSRDELPRNPVPPVLGDI